MSAEDVRKNYSEVGAALIEKLYSDDYLSIGGTQSTDTLATNACISEKTRVLDVGSGLGGPALHLAETRGCRVTGLDLVETNVLEANKRAKARELDHLVAFRAGDATAMPFESGSFDVVWGQDAWCHVPDKDKLIEEGARVLTTEGTFAFTDWLQTGEMDEAQRAAVHDATASTNMATLESYCGLLEKHGFTVRMREDISATFVGPYREIIARLKRFESDITETFSAKVFGIMLEKNGRILRAFEDNLIGGGKIVANRV